ncbi:glycoside hydrolase family 32 protein [Streptomyces sp. NPDC002033]|uniref:glycoside hydrolase family 32 protein n=1 Tax=unclassified Streptomyces TaxID=2593676 RepID=UPI0033215DCC
MVAVYTSHYKDGGKQAQSLAYGTDRGRTWTKYAGNPVLDIGSTEFRDPKVQRYAPAKSWLMTVSLATEHKVRFYSSKDLKSWTHLSDFGPQNAVGGVWECPDLFPLPVDGDPERMKWVLVVNVNAGAIAEGSAAQYFVGDFDGKRFEPDDDGSNTPPGGLVVQDFEGAGYGTWQTAGTAFGDGPAPAPAPGTSGTSGFEGKGLVDSFHGGDDETGTLTSAPSTVDSKYLNFKVAGGRHPHVPGSVMGESPAPAGKVPADFEQDGYGSWTATGPHRRRQSPLRIRRAHRRPAPRGRQARAQRHRHRLGGPTSRPSRTSSGPTGSTTARTTMPPSPERAPRTASAA